MRYVIERYLITHEDALALYVEVIERAAGHIEGCRVDVDGVVAFVEDQLVVHGRLRQPHSLIGVE